MSRKHKAKPTIFIFTGEFAQRVRGVGTSCNNLYDALSEQYKVIVIEDPTPTRRTPMYLKYKSRDAEPKPVSQRQILAIMKSGDIAIFEYATFADMARSLPKGVKSFYRAHGVVPLWLDRNILTKQSEFAAENWCAKKQVEMSGVVDSVLALSPENERMCSQAFPEANVNLLQNSISLVERDRSGVLFLGACSSRKGAPDLLQAARLMPDVQFTIVGQASIEYIRECDGIPNVVYVTHTSDKFRIIGYLRKSKVLAVPSYYEGIPYTIVEAMREMTPVATYPFDGVSDIGLHPDCIAGDCTPTALVKTMRTLYDKSDLDEIAEHNMRSLLERYTKAKQLKRFEDVIYA